MTTQQDIEAMVAEAVDRHPNVTAVHLDYHLSNQGKPRADWVCWVQFAGEHSAYRYGPDPRQALDAATSAAAEIVSGIDRAYAAICGSV